MKKQSLAKKKKKRLKVGFDLDGVILYNPARIIRPIVSSIKRVILHKKRVSFYVPKTKTGKLLWEIFHLSSIYKAAGFEDIKRMSKEKEIDAYIITARYSFLEKGFKNFIKNSGAQECFTACHFNEKDEQPHKYKERLLNELDLDIFVEDNYDIATHLAKKYKDKTIIWIYNILDAQRPFKHKYPTLKKAVNFIKEKVKT